MTEVSTLQGQVCVSTMIAQREIWHLKNVPHSTSIPFKSPSDESPSTIKVFMLHCHEWPLVVVHIKPYSPPPRNIVQFYNRLDCRVCITRSFICIGESYLLCVSIIALFRVRGNTMSTMSTLSCDVKQSSLAKQGNITHTDSTTTDKKLHSFSLSLSDMMTIVESCSSFQVSLI